ncbi:tryptophan-rich sensory protein [Mucilaginibacter terrigena]|uniref:Tryptophan-rich sensory protein n=1 Tax=Mucilaginibacter terrigena TaxID=2492395 RepID=A0A4Q5LLS3_9SPHI|nr:TspO/MBR family protein [Mucilaginibacter terrigena]RYU90033.1 tryptophan-rich sensory protein [Mucilaginibacter terrigena]
MSSKPLNNKFQLLPLLVSIAITFTIGIVASLFTRPEITGWYQTLRKPSFTPPNWLFPVAWSTLYLLIAISAYIIWKHRDSRPKYKTAVIIYFTQLALNFSWSIVFFGMHQVLGGLIIIIALLVTIILNIAWFARINKPAAWLLVPYIAWVLFATLLNISICVLNK